MNTEHLIGEEVFIYGLGYIIWDEENERAVQELAAEIERIAPESGSANGMHRESK